MNVRDETTKHIGTVATLLLRVVSELCRRATNHDASKLQSPEAEVFEEFTPKLKGCTYGSEEYWSFLKGMKPALEHHYRNNLHHPEFHDDGIRDMTLVDLIEMLLDWKAASLRQADGDILKSIELNKKRFGYSDELKRIFLNTINDMDLADRRDIPQEIK